MKKLAALLAYLLYLVAVIEVLCAVYSLSGLSPTHHMPPYVLPADQELTPLSQWRTSGTLRPSSTDRRAATGASDSAGS